MRPPKNIYPPTRMSGCSEMSGGMFLLRVWTARQINKHSTTLKGTRWCEAGPWHLARASLHPIRASLNSAVDISAPMGGVFVAILCTCMCIC